jgi:GGDEF domain-containing protein
MLKFDFIQALLPKAGQAEHLHADSSHQHIQRLIPRKFEGLEATILLFCGAYGLLVALLILKMALLPMLLSLLLIALGIVRWHQPARSKLQWWVDALLAVMIVAGLFGDSHTGGSAGPYLFLVLLFAITFPLLMDFSSALVFGGLLLLVYFAFGRGPAWNVPPMLFALRGVLVAGLCFISAQFGMVLRQSEETVEQLRHDLESGAYNMHGWLRYGEPALRQCNLRDKPLSLVYLSMPSDWTRQISQTQGFVSPHPQELRQLRAKALQEMAQSLRHALPGDSLVGRDANGDWVLVMPGMRSKEALLLLERSFGRPLQLSFGPYSDEMFVSLMPCVVQAQNQESLQDLHARATDIWSRGVLSGAV